MAQRRMISKEICYAGNFIRLSDKAVRLYLYCVLGADDEGIVDVYAAMKLSTVTNLEAFKELIERGYLYQLSPKDDFLSYVAEWDSFNRVQQSRFIPSKHHELKVKLADRLSLEGAAAFMLADLTEDNADE